MRYGNVLYKLIQLNTRSHEMLSHIDHLAALGPDCGAALEHLEQFAADANSLKTNSEGTAGLEAEAPSIDAKIAQLLSAKREVREILLREPKLSAQKQQVLTVLAAIADTHPGDGGTLITGDGPFAYMLTLAADEESTTTLEHLMQGFVARLIELNAKAKPLLARLCEYCDRPDFRKIVNELDARLDSFAAGDDDVLKGGSEHSLRLLNLCAPMLASPVDRSVLYGTPRIFQIPPGFFKAFPSGESSVSEDADPGSSLQALQQRAAHARKVRQAMESENPELQSAVDLRLDATLDFLARRRFVKWQILEFSWPQLMSYVRAPGGQRRLLELERAVREPMRRSALSARWQEYLADERLMEFLSMPPYFAEMIRAPEFAGDEFGTPGDVAAYDDVPGPKTAAYDNVPELKTAASSSGGASGESVELDQYADVYLTLTALDDDASAVISSADPADEFLPASLELSFAGRSSEINIRIPMREVRQLLEALSYSYRESYAQPQTAARMMTVNNEPLPSPDDILEDIGTKLWNALLVDQEEHNALLDFLAAERRVRFIVTCTGRGLEDVPWECLYVPALQIFAGITLRISVVRNVLHPKDLVRREIDPPLRVLLVSALPHDAPWLNADQEITLIKRALEPAVRLGVLRIDELKNPDEERLQRQLRLFRPHVFHFIGHGGIGRDGQGAVLLVDENGDGIEVNASRIGTLLRARGILVAVLNSCYTGIANSDIARSVAKVLVREGVPLAIAPSRAILDRAALQFAREFYSALMDGYAVEAAVIEARKLLSVKGWDWSTYLTYSTERARQADFWPRLSVR